MISQVDRMAEALVKDINHLGRMSLNSALPIRSIIILIPEVEFYKAVRTKAIATIFTRFIIQKLLCMHIHMHNEKKQGCLLSYR